MVTFHLTKDDVRAAFLAWEKDRRDGKCAPIEEVDKLTPEQVADDSTTTFIEYVIKT